MELTKRQQHKQRAERVRQLSKENPEFGPVKLAGLINDPELTPKLISNILSCARKPPRIRRTLVMAQQAVSSSAGIKSVGVLRANEALNCLIRIPKDDALRQRGFQIVSDWIKSNI